MRHRFFLTATWLPHRQLRATVKGAASLTQRLLLCLFFEKQEPCSKTESQSLAESPVGFETGSFQFSVYYLITIGLPACLPACLPGNKAKEQISKQVLQENKALQIFQKTNISYPLYAH